MALETNGRYAVKMGESRKPLTYFGQVYKNVPEPVFVPSSYPDGSASTIYHFCQGTKIYSFTRRPLAVLAYILRGRT